MRGFVGRLLATGLLTGLACTSYAAEQVGEAVLVKTAVTGGGGRVIATKSPVHRDERIRTSTSGLGEFVFRDGTKFAVGGNSSVVIDKFVFDGNKSVRTLTVNATKGSFRWISGGSKSTSYKIATPAGTIGIRGTAFDVYIGPGGLTGVVLLKGSVQFCGANGCRDLKRRCDFVMATPKGGVTAPARVSRASLQKLQNARALPFMTGDQRLSRRFQIGTDCLSTASINSNKATPAPQSAPASEPSPEPEPPAPEPTGRGNNGLGNGGDDGTPNGRDDADR
jgi:hypothetical protein